ncbi:programmed cell death protein 4-like [Lethenteron reissneri]|uniref:Programmed cell death protein 4 n=1 Tax=Lethenteron camtschaticum TaxID=980415 RepID=A0A6G7QU81_LETCA|nr:programmed cell death protein 4-like [Lethenteron reissneri]XP_061412155.1 programmed cell death protein 4-like [Lethenteron reissneri]QDS02592.1 PDCD4 [Lethenteron camtschaticum]
MAAETLEARPAGRLAPGAEFVDAYDYDDVDDSEDFGEEMNGNWSPQEKALHEARIRAREKRRLRKSSSRDSGRESLSEESRGGDGVRGPGGAGTLSVSPTSPRGKAPPLLDRRSRSNKGRGLPKKGGAGGKGVWGVPGQIYDDINVDARDPNYDDAQENCVYETVVPELEDGNFEKTVTPIVQEYFEHGDTNEVMVLLSDLNLGSRKPQLPVLAVSLSLEGRASHREFTSRLLAELAGRELSPVEMNRAFNRLLKELPELMLDTPDAPQMVGQFVARAVADEVLPPNFLESHKGKVDCPHARAALERAAVLLSIKRGIMRLDNVWGVGGGQRPVKHLVKEMTLLLKEYLLSGDVKEAERCLRELEVPHFHHELVFEAVVMVLESNGEAVSSMMVNLLKVFWGTGVLTLDQMNRGFERVFGELPDISLDVPRAYALLERFVESCFQAGVVTKLLRDRCPIRGRKRFVSEGDGGRVKQEAF